MSERLIAYCDQAVRKTLRLLRICALAFGASVLVLWQAVPLLPPAARRLVFGVSAVVAGFTAASLVVLGMLLAVWIAKRKAAVELRVELDAREGE